MTIPSPPVNSVFSITPVTGIPESVAGISERGEELLTGLLDALVEADEDETKAGVEDI